MENSPDEDAECSDSGTVETYYANRRRRAKFWHGRHKRAKKWSIGAVLTLVIAGSGAAGTLWNANTNADKSATSSASPGDSPSTTSPLAAPKLSPVPASPLSPPLLIESVTPPRSTQHINGTIATPELIDMNPSQLDQWQQSILPNTGSYEQWSVDNKAALLDDSIISMTVRNNIGETVTLSDVKITKTCSSPFDGSFFKPYSQGGGGPDLYRIGFDLDAQAPTALEMAFTNGRGLAPDGQNFFDANSPKVEPRQSMTIAIDSFTKRYSCSFFFTLFVATPTGTQTERVPTTGSYSVTSTARPKDLTHPYSGYKSLYVEGPTPDQTSTTWSRVDPEVYEVQ